MGRASGGRLEFLDDGGEMGARMRAFDWPSHPLGPPQAWPQGLRTAVRLMLTTNHPVFIFWGPEQYCFYNDAYRASVGPEKHPAMLGRKAREMWTEIWPIIGPQIEQVLSGGGATWHRDHLVPIYRNGALENVYWTYSYSPIDEAGGIGGVLVICTETTERVEAEQRLKLFDRIAQVTIAASDAELIMAQTTEMLARYLKVAICAYADVESDQDRFTVRGEWKSQGSRSLLGPHSLDVFGATAAGILRRGAHFVTRNVSAELAPDETAPFVALGLHATICVPLIKDQRLTALMAVHSATPRIWYPAEIALVEEVAKRSWAHIERVRAINAQRDSERQFRDLANAMPQLVWTADSSGQVTYYNARRDEYFGGDLQTAQRFAWDVLVHPDDLPRTLAIWRQCLTTGTPYVCEHRLRMADGAWVWHVSRAEAARDEAGAVTKWYGTATNIAPTIAAREVLARSQSELEQAIVERTAALQTSEARLRAVFQTTHLFQSILTPDGILLECNLGSLMAFGSSAQDIVGKPFWEMPWFSHTPGLPDGIRHLVQRCAQGENDERAVTLMSPLGPRNFDASMRPIRDESGKIIAILAEASETTARVRAEENLRQAQKLEAIGQLTGGIAHDFNNLLTVVSGGLNLLDRATDQSRKDMLFSRMREAVARGVTLTHQLLAFSRKHELQPETIDVARHIADMNDLLDRSLGANIRVRVDIPRDVHLISADPNALQLAILNLAVNARDAMPEGGTIEIYARNGTPENPAAPCVGITVKDTGTGMTDAVRAKIFEPFFTTKDIGKGTGLGLAQVHGFSQQSGGYVHVESEPGRGTAMTLILPRSADGLVARAPLHLANLRTAPATLNRGHVLLVEDDAGVAALAREMLEHLGWRVTRVSSVESALETLVHNAGDGARRPDLVFSDVMMPGGQSGLQLAYAIRKEHPQLPVILTSGYSAAIRVEAEQAGLPLLSKPFNLDTLAAIIDVAVLGASAPPAGGTAPGLSPDTV